VNSIELALKSGYNVLVAGLVFGAGLPVLYALALRALTIGSTEVVAEDGTVRYRRSLLGRVLAVVLVAVVIGGVVLGLLLIVWKGLGLEVSFEHIVPTISKKE
jgi:hypothetical protein